MIRPYLRPDPKPGLCSRPWLLTLTHVHPGSLGVPEQVRHRNLCSARLREKSQDAPRVFRERLFLIFTLLAEPQQPLLSPNSRADAFAFEYTGERAIRANMSMEGPRLPCCFDGQTVQAPIRGPPCTLAHPIICQAPGFPPIPAGPP